MSLGENHLAGHGGSRGTREGIARYAAGKRQLFVEFISADRRDIISLRVKEQVVDKSLRAFHYRRLARTKLLVYLLKRLFIRAGAVLFGLLRHEILFKRGVEYRLVAEKRFYPVVGRKPERAQQHGYGYLAVFVYPYIKHARRIGLVFKPCAPVRDDGGGKKLSAALVLARLEINPGGPGYLGNDDSFRAVYYERAAVGHHGEIPHIYLLLLELAGHLVRETHVDLEGHGVVHVALLAFLDLVFGRVAQRVTDKVDHKVAAVIGHGRNILKHRLDIFGYEVLKRLLLHLNQIGHLKDLVVFRKRHPNGPAELPGLYHLNQSDHSCLFFVNFL